MSHFIILGIALRLFYFSIVLISWMNDSFTLYYNLYESDIFISYLYNAFSYFLK